MIDSSTSEPLALTIFENFAGVFLLFRICYYNFP